MAASCPAVTGINRAAADRRGPVHRPSPLEAGMTQGTLGERRLLGTETDFLLPTAPKARHRTVGGGPDGRRAEAGGRLSGRPRKDRFLPTSANHQRCSPPKVDVRQAGRNAGAAPVEQGAWRIIGMGNRRRCVTFDCDDEAPPLTPRVISLFVEPRRYQDRPMASRSSGRSCGNQESAARQRCC